MPRPRARPGGLNAVTAENRRRESEVGELTTGQRWRLRRDLVIYIAAEAGASQRLLGDVFDLPHSRIHAILKSMRRRYGTDEPTP